jgi:hypothetical protein
MEAWPAIERASAQRIPVTMRAPNGPGAVRAPIFDVLSAKSSPMASTVKMPTAIGLARNARGDPARFSQPRCAAQQTTAGGVRERRPQATPMSKQSKKMEVIYYSFRIFASELWNQQELSCRFAASDVDVGLRGFAEGVGVLHADFECACVDGG